MMNRKRRGTVLAWSASLILPAGLAVAGAAPPVVNGVFVFQSDVGGTNNCSEIEFGGEFFEVDGEVTGLGLDDDTITITYDQDFISGVNAKSDRGRIQQKEGSEVIVQLTPGAGSPTPAYTGAATPEKCKIQGAIKDAGASAKVKLKCDLGPNFDQLTPPPSPAQLSSILTGFGNRKDVKLRDNGKVKITQKGDSVVTCP